MNIITEIIWERSWQNNNENVFINVLGSHQIADSYMEYYVCMYKTRPNRFKTMQII